MLKWDNHWNIQVWYGKSWKKLKYWSAHVVKHYIHSRVRINWPSLLINDFQRCPCVNAGDISYRMAQDYTSLLICISIKMLISGLSIRESDRLYNLCIMCYCISSIINRDLNLLFIEMRVILMQCFLLMDIYSWNKLIFISN